METNQDLRDHAAGNSALNERLENIAWGLFLVIIGVTWLEAGTEIPVGVCLIGAGLIMLLLNAVRYLSGIETSGFTIGLGSVALLAGIASALSVKIIGVLFILIGASIILRPFFEKKRVVSRPAVERPAENR